MISVEKISKKYGEQLALNQVSFTIGKGEIVGFLGPNGAGKSTMMKILTGYIAQDSGSAKINDEPVSLNKLDFKHRIGYLPENNPLYTDLYVKEYLNFVGGLYKLPNLKQRIDDLIDMTGLNAECHKKIAALSKGYRQRVGLAQALLPDPDVLILDEPTTGLDPNQIVEVRKLIHVLGKEKTVMLSTHIMQEVHAICERAIIINKGQIVADAKVKDLGSGSNTVSISVEFENEINTDALLELRNVETLKVLNGIYKISATGDIRKDIAKLAAEKDWLILSMNIERESLEDVFRELTNN